MRERERESECVCVYDSEYVVHGGKLNVCLCESYNCEYQYCVCD